MASQPGERDASKKKRGDVTYAGWKYICDFKECKVGALCVVLASYKPEVGASGEATAAYQYINVGRVVSVDDQSKCIEVDVFAPTKDPWSASCTAGQWNKKRRPAIEQFEHRNVIKYFGAFIGARASGVIYSCE